MKTLQRTAAVVHLDRLRANAENIRARLQPQVDMIAVLKGDGYSHGIEGIVPTLRQCGIGCFAVAIWQEGALLRRIGVTDEPVLVLGDTWDGELEQLVLHRLTGTIFAEETARKLNEIAARHGVVQPIHIKFDTGMHRIGFGTDEAALDTVARIAALPNLTITGAFTHFARADEMDCDVTDTQYQRFMGAIDALRQRGIEIPFLHVANSPSILLRPEVQLQAVRAGDALFGLCPIDEALWPQTALQEVLTWQTYVALVKTVPAGSQIGYGGTHVTDRDTVVATLPVGFADGYDRRLSNLGYVMIHGQKAPILGRVCMDQMMVDVTDIPDVQRGDVVTLLGDGISIVEMAGILQVNVDEILCRITKRVPRVYVDEE